MTEMKWLKATCACFLAGLLAIGALVVIIDPFFHYHKPLKGFPYQIDNQLSQNPGMAEHLCYDSLILGSSMTVNFETDWFLEDMKLHTLKLSYNGAYPRDIHNIMEKVDEGGQELRQVFLGVDLASYSGGVLETKYPIPEYLYNKNPFDDVKYLYNKGVLLDYILKPLAEREPTDLSSVYSSEAQLEGCYSKEYVLAHYEIPEKNDAYFPEDMFIDGLEKNLEENILPVIETHPDTKFTVFFPPYSVLYWYEYICNGQMDAVMYEYNYFVEKLLPYGNVELFFFPAQEDIVCNLDLYADTGHYRQSINHYMETCFADGSHRLTVNNYKEELQKLKHLTDTYDYDALLAEEEAL